MLGTFLGPLVPPSVTSARPPAAGGCRRNDSAAPAGPARAAGGRHGRAQDASPAAPERRRSGAGRTGPATPGWGARSTAGQAAGTGHGVGLRHGAEDPPRPATAVTHEHVKPEHPAQELGPGPASLDRRRHRPHVGRQWPRHDGRSPASARGQHAVVREQRSARRGHQGRQPFQQFQRGQEERRACSARSGWRPSRGRPVPSPPRDPPSVSATTSRRRAGLPADPRGPDLTQPARPRSGPCRAGRPRARVRPPRGMCPLG